MSNNGEFSEEQSEELISHLNSGGPSEFEHLRSALNLLAHVTELPPTSIPPVLPSGITQPIPLLPVKSTKPRRTVVTSVIVVGILASASLAAAAVTGIGPAPIVNIGHETAKFVKGVASAVNHVVTGGQAETVEIRPPQIPGLVPAPTGGEDSLSNSNEGSDDDSNVPLPPIPSALTPEAKHSSEGKDGKSGKESKSNSDESQSPNSDSSDSSDNSDPVIISPIATPAPSPKVEKGHTESDGQKTPEPSTTTSSPTDLPSPISSDQSSEED